MTTHCVSYRQKLSQEYYQQFQTLFQQWDTEMQKAEEQEQLTVKYQACFCF